ncbi:MAG: hypothetical protein GC168_21140 [Candidatus Hydrogenedens sp.]|nr:hypothetical protein [Candidatus Hydrogenedens sp.]
MNRPRLVMVHAGGIGDFILTLPALRALSADWRIDLAGRTERLELARAAGWAKAVRSLEGSGFESLFGTPDDRARSFFGSADRVVVWMRDSDGVLRDALAACGATDLVIEPGLPPDDYGSHASQYYWERLGLPGEAPPPFLPVPPTDAGCEVVLHPGSGSTTKNWPLEHFESVARALEQDGLRVTWISGPAEIERGLAVTGADATPSLVDLAAKLAGARLYLGNDSGITHLAAAVMCPTVAVFGPTDPAVWGPRGDRVRIVVERPWPDKERVLAAARELLGR